MSPATPASRWRRGLSWLWRSLLAVVVLDALYLAWIWPDWDALAQGAIPKSRFIQDYEAERRHAPDLPALRWQPLPLGRIPRQVQRAVIVAEDARFYAHSGIDLAALREAIEHNIDKGRVVYGASTLSQQTAKNLFLTASRDPLRKWHELVLTLVMEWRLSKSRILELYLNSAEFGRGIYGVEAAARHYWGIPAQALSGRQAVELAATLPSPRLHNPRTRTRTFLHRARKIQGFLG